MLNLKITCAASVMGLASEALPWKNRFADHQASDQEGMTLSSCAMDATVAAAWLGRAWYVVLPHDSVGSIPSRLPLGLGF